MEDEPIQVVLKYKPEWTTQLEQWNKQSKNAVSIEPDDTIIPFTSEEKYQMKDLPNSEYILVNNNKICSFLQP